MECRKEEDVKTVVPADQPSCSGTITLIDLTEQISSDSDHQEDLPVVSFMCGGDKTTPMGGVSALNRGFIEAPLNEVHMHHRA